MCSLCCDVFLVVFFFFKQKTAYEMRISDWSSDVCSSDPADGARRGVGVRALRRRPLLPVPRRVRGGRGPVLAVGQADRKSVVSGKSVSVRVDLGGRRIIQKKKRSISMQYAHNKKHT